LGQTEIVKWWWAYMKDIMETNEDNSPVTVFWEEVFLRIKFFSPTVRVSLIERDKQFYC